MTPNMQIALVTIFVVTASAAVAVHKDEINDYFKNVNDAPTSTQQQPVVKTEKPTL